MVNLFGLNLFGSNIFENKGSCQNFGGSFMGGAGPELLIGLMSVFTGGGLFGGGSCGMGGGLFGGGSMGCGMGAGMLGGLLGGGHRNNNYGGYNSYNQNYGGYGSYNQNYGEDYGRDYNSYGQGHRSYGRGYENRNDREGSSGGFFMKALGSYGITRIIMGFISGLKGSPAKTNAPVQNSGVNTEPKTVNKSQEFDNWAQQVAKGQQKGNFAFVGDDFAKDIKTNGGKNAGEIYKNGVTRLANDYIKQADTNHDGVVDYNEYRAKEKADAAKLGVESNEEKLKTGFNTLNINDKNADGTANNTLDVQEISSEFALMDRSPNSKGEMEMDGTIGEVGFLGVSSGIANPDKNAAIKENLVDMRKMIFGQ